MTKIKKQTLQFLHVVSRPVKTFVPVKHWFLHGRHKGVVFAHIDASQLSSHHARTVPNLVITGVEVARCKNWAA
jgi:hypothetical protein